MKVFIDGENFRHQVSHILVDAQLFQNSQKNDFFKFDIAGFVHGVLADDSEHQIKYYTTRIKQPSHKIPKKLADKLNRISTANRRWLAQLSNQKIEIVKAGHLKVRESSACINCSKKTMVLQEKGVDVRVAIDILQAINSKQIIVLFSSDSDIVPSLQAIKNLGGKVVYVCPANRVNRAIVAQVSNVITFDIKQVVQYYRSNND